jgi:glycosidase
MGSTFQNRLEDNIEKLEIEYFNLYQRFGATKSDFDSLLRVLKEEDQNRGEFLKKKDLEGNKWFLNEDKVGYMVYTKLFSGDLKKFALKIPYLKDLGVNVIHLMPVLKPREGENDGGYAVEDYLNINPDLGSKQDFLKLLADFQKEGIDVCIDYVLNHTSNTHEWAKKALDGDVKYQNMYMMYDNDYIPNEYNKTVPEVLPLKHPGNFSYVSKINKWVFTSFSDFQWDLNFKNPYVFEKMVEILLKLANMGVRIIRLDAIPFIWKELSTSCRNLKEAHDLIRLFHIIKDIVCPSLVLLGEAIVEPKEIYKYFGTEGHSECDLLYNANFMVNIWNAFAAKDVRLLNMDQSDFVPHRNASWINYVRCHDDIGWGLNEDAQMMLGIDPFLHKQYLISFFNGSFPNSFAKGENYQYNDFTKDARTNGMTASLLGLEKALEEAYPFEIEQSIKRLFLAYAIVFSHNGIPMIYSGDELAVLNDQSYLQDSHKQTDGRWVHRPIFDWKKEKKRFDLSTIENRVFQLFQTLISIRKSNSVFHSAVKQTVILNDDIGVYSFYKKNNNQTLVCLFNFNDYNSYISLNPYKNIVTQKVHRDLFSNRKIDINNDRLMLSPYEVVWILEENNG